MLDIVIIKWLIQEIKKPYIPCQTDQKKLCSNSMFELLIRSRPLTGNSKLKYQGAIRVHRKCHQQKVQKNMNFC